MNCKDLTKIILDKIKKDRINPKPRWQFLLKDYFIWILSFLFLIIGSFAVSVIIFLVKNNDWDIYEHVNNSFLEFALSSLPYFWIALLIIFILSSYYNFKHTKKGYKYQFYFVIAGGILFSILFGILLFNFGAGPGIDNIFTENISFYEKMVNKRKTRWTSDEKGFLAGKVISDYEMNKFQILDLRERIWDVENKECWDIKRNIILGDYLRIIGEKKGENIFEAHKIMPMRPQDIKWLLHSTHTREPFMK
ncbi:MAG: hypothetical protein ABIA02_01415 [Candidatus Falkowbacteria bacterium]